MNRFYVYDIPAEVINALSVFGESQLELQRDILQPVEHYTPGTCSYCGKFQGPTNQHYKTDYHRYNIRLSLNGLPALTEEQFDLQIGDVDESLSGSDSESDSDLSDVQEDSQNNTIANQASGSPQILYNLPLKDGETEKCLAVYKTLLDDVARPVDSLLKLQSLKYSHSVILMIGGGHFSGAVISHVATNHRNTPTNPYASIKVLEHKTFHRYTTRRKQGGSQSASDNSRGKAKSAGSSLRRYNELALIQDVRKLLDSWRELIDSASSIYIRASGRSNRGILMNYDKSPINSTDNRLKSMPFTTKRATASEINRAWQELTQARVMDKPQPELETKKEVVKELKQKKESKSKEQSPAPVDPLQKHTTEIINLIKKGKAPKLMLYFKMNKLDFDFEFQPSNPVTPTALFYAAHDGHKQIVTSLLATNKINLGAVNSSHKTAFEVATESAKQAFQVYRYENPDAFDYESAKVGPAVSAKDLQLQVSVEKLQLEEEQKKQLEQLKDTLKQDKLDGIVARHGEGKKLVSTPVSADLNGLSEEAKMKLERERRARAAEARFGRR